MLGLTRDSLRLDLVVIVAWVVLAFAVEISVRNLFLNIGVIGMTLMLLPPILYLGLRHPKPWKKILLGSLIFGVLLGFFYEFVMEAAGGYHVQSYIWPRLFDLVPIDSVFAHALMTCLTLVFYEHFIVRKLDTRISPRYKWGLVLAGAMALVVVMVHYASPGLLAIPYPYATLATVAVLPIFIATYRRPSIAGQWLGVVPFFFFTYMLFMIVAVRYSWWRYPFTTDYIGWVMLKPNTIFPFEELLFWMALYAPALVVYYKFFIEPKTDR